MGKRTEHNANFHPFLCCNSINDSCTLLTMPLGSAILLRETLLSPTGDEESWTRALQEVGLAIFDRKATLDVLDRRNDMPRIG